MSDGRAVELRHGRVGDAEAVVAVPVTSPPRCAVLVLAGSSGRIDETRVRLLASVGAVAVGLRWFAGKGQPAGICEVALESFTPALDLLAGYEAPLAVLGTSKGAEAACLLALSDPRVSTVVAFAPTDVVWANIGAGRDGRDKPPRSSWTRAGEPLPFVPLASGWTATDDPPAYLGWYLQSRRVHSDRVQLATIPLERFDGTVLLVAGEDDQVWDSAASANRISAQRAGAGRTTTVLIGSDAGHRTLLPGETPSASGHQMQRGGTRAADTALGADAWSRLVPALDLRPR